MPTRWRRKRESRVGRANPTWTWPCTSDGCSFSVNVAGDSPEARKDNAASAAIRHEEETGHVVAERPVPHYGEPADLPELD